MRATARRALASFSTRTEYNALNESRFWGRAARVDVGCWEWTAGKSSGYGIITWMGRDTKAPRVAWELANGPIPEGMCVRHICDNPGCVRPSHLLIGTHQQNMQDIVDHGAHRGANKTHCPHGHEYSESNTYRLASGRRQCKACTSARSKAAYLARKAELSTPEARRISADRSRAYRARRRKEMEVEDTGDE